LKSDVGILLVAAVDGVAVVIVAAIVIEGVGRRAGV
jgi:hypothetical protein